MCSLCESKLALRLEIVAFCLVLLLPSNARAPNQEININNTTAIVEHWCHQLASETTVKSVLVTILHNLITLPPNKNIEIFAAMDTSSVIFKLS